jgi:hypothetical protein
MQRIEVIPQTIAALPNDRFAFTARADANVRPLWGEISNGTITIDNGLTNVIAGTVAGVGQHALFSGLGYIQWTIDDKQRPTGGGALIYTASFNAGALVYNITIATTQIVIRDEASTVLTTITYSVVSGDVFRLELSGGFRLYRNGVFLHARVSGLGGVNYPATYRVDLAATVAGSPQTIAAPTLIGDWRLRTDAAVIWTTPSHGGISMTAGPKTEYFGGTIPGSYFLQAWIEQANDPFQLQQNSATINIPPLFILGPGEITIQPGQKIRPKTNYDEAQTALVAWTIGRGGGSIAQNEFTAPAAPGASVLRATCSANGNVAELTVNVPAVITNANAYLAAKVSEQIDFNTNIPVLPYFVAAGAVAEGTGNVTPGLPADLKAKDIMWMWVQSANESVPTPSGWGVPTTSPQGTGTAAAAGSVRLSAFWKRAAAIETAPTVTDPGNHVIAQIVSIRGCVDTGDPWDGTPAGDTAASNSAVSIPGATTGVDNCLILQAVAHATDTATPQASAYTNADLANLTERTDVSTTQGVGGGFAVVTGEKAVAGAYGATTATLATASAQGRLSFALKPATITWAASIGSINATSGVWTAPALAGDTARITVTNGALTAALELDVLEAFPRSDFNLPWPIDLAKRVLISESEDGSRTSRIKTPARRAFPVTLLVDDVADLNGAGLSTIRAFWDRHHPGVRFILDDPEEVIRLVVYSDSDLRWEHTSAGINIAFRVKEA